MEINGHEVWVKLPGRFNAENLLCAYGTCVLLGHNSDEVLAALSELNPVAGRFETFRSGNGTTAIVDYAHTPDALQNVLGTIREVNVAGGEIITVVGAGGNRDRGKRPLMAKIVAESSHKVILTSDNPRDEELAKLRRELAVVKEEREILRKALGNGVDISETCRPPGPPTFSSTPSNVRVTGPASIGLFVIVI